MTFDMKSVAGRNFLNLLKFHQQRTSYINMLDASTTKHVWKNVLEANQEIPGADQHDWDVVDGTYKIGWTIKLPLMRF